MTMIITHCHGETVVEISVNGSTVVYTTVEGIHYHEEALRLLVEKFQGNGPGSFVRMASVSANLTKDFYTLKEGVESF